jgi:hydrogenase nickel incorporation protein HypA/HybF
MHEFSIVNALLEMCEKNARQNNASKITRVEVKIGKLSGVEAHFLETAFETFKEQTVCDQAEFVMHIQDVVIRCNHCSQEATLQEYELLCPVCQSTDVSIVDGEEMYLMRLEME